MAAITAAAIGAAATIGTTAYGMSQQSGGGGSTQPKFAQTPQNPQDKAMRDYYARLTTENVDKTYPSFGAYLESGGDPDKAKFDMTVPGMKPSEAAALGIVGGRGESIPYVDPKTGLPVAPSNTLTPQQTLYLAQERRRQAAATGQDPNKSTWATRAVTTANTLNRVTDRLNTLQAIEDPNARQQRRIGKLTNRQTNLTNRQQDIFGGDPTPGA